MHYQDIIYLWRLEHTRWSAVSSNDADLHHG